MHIHIHFPFSSSQCIFPSYSEIISFTNVLINQWSYVCVYLSSISILQHILVLKVYCYCMFVSFLLSLFIFSLSSFVDCRGCCWHLATITTLKYRGQGVAMRLIPSRLCVVICFWHQNHFLTKKEM